MQNTILPSTQEFKKQAKELKKKDKNIKSLGHALNIMAQKYGHKNWNTIKDFLVKKEPLVLTTVYINIYTRQDNEIYPSKMFRTDGKPTIEVFGSEEEANEDILFYINEVRGTNFPTLDDAWEVYESEGEDWISRNRISGLIVQPEGRPDPISAELDREQVNKNGKKAYVVSIQEDSDNLPECEYYHELNEAMSRIKEINELATTDWALIKKPNVMSTYRLETASKTLT